MAVVLSATAVFFVPCRAQTSPDSASPTKPVLPYAVKPLPVESTGAQYTTKTLPPVQTVTPFSEALADKHPIEYRSADQMNAADRALAASAERSIREGAALAGIDFDMGRWSYQQIVCAALPNHVFLLFEANNGPGDESLFSAAIPRSGNGRVRIIPIQRRGFSMFSPAPVNKLAISAFNRIRADEPESKTTDWLSVAACYGALTGPRLRVSVPSDKSANSDIPVAFPPTLEVESDGESTVRFVDVAAPPQLMQWALTFDAKGQLIRVEHSAAPGYSMRIIP